MNLKLYKTRSICIKMLQIITVVGTIFVLNKLLLETNFKIFKK